MAGQIKIIADPNVLGQLFELDIISSPESDAPPQMIDAVRFQVEQGRKIEAENPIWGYYPSSRAVIEWPILKVNDDLEFQDEEWVLEISLDELSEDLVVMASITKSYRLNVPPLKSDFRPPSDPFDTH